MSSKNNYCLLLSVVAVINLVLVGFKPTLTGCRYRLNILHSGLQGEGASKKKKKKTHLS